MRVAIVGYGNLGRGVEAALCAAPDIVISVVLEKGYSGGLASLTAARILEAYYSEK